MLIWGIRMKPRERNLRLAPTEGVRDQLDVLVDMGFFKSPSAAASHILNVYTGVVVRSMQESRDATRQRRFQSIYVTNTEPLASN